MGDGITWSVMVGIGESYLAAFALALGMGELVAGLIASVPILVGAVLQLIAPFAIRRAGSYRRWVIACVFFQAASFVPLAIAAMVGRIPITLLFLLAAIYWGTGMASGPAWSMWVDTLMPERIRSRYFGVRSRIAQIGTLVGFVGGGAWLQWGEANQRPLAAFALLFCAAATIRFLSLRYLAAQTEPSPPPSGATSARSVVDLLSPLSHRGDRRLLLYLWAMQASAQIASPYFTPLMLGQLKFSYWRYMLVLATSMAMKAIALPTIGRLARRVGAARLLRIGGLLVIPMPVLWIFCTATPYLIVVQILAGTAWATYELAAFLIFFEAVDSRRRIGVMTLFNFGNAAATVAGSLLGGLLLTVGGESLGYTAVFVASCLGRLSIVPLASRIGSQDRVAEDVEPAIPLLALRPTPVEDLAANRAA